MYTYKEIDGGRFLQKHDERKIDWDKVAFTIVMRALVVALFFA